METLSRPSTEPRLYEFAFGPEHTTTHTWSKDGRNHAFSVQHMNSHGHQMVAPECARAASTSVPTAWAFAGELSRNLGEDRDHTHDCPRCFRRRPIVRRRRAW